MPCYDPREKEGYEEARKEVRTLQALLDLRTAQLCSVLSAWEGGAAYDSIPPQIEEWWTVHKAWDAIRKGGLR